MPAALAAAVVLAAALLRGVAADEGRAAVDEGFCPVQDALGEPVALMQTFHRVGRRVPPGRIEASGPEALAPAQTLCDYQWAPLWQQALNESLQALGFADTRPPCRAADLGEGAAPLSLLGVAAEHVASPSLLGDWRLPCVLPLAYLTIFGLVLARMMLSVLVVQPRAEANPQKAPLAKPLGGSALRRPEAEAWEQGLASWLSATWASEWVARWGGPASAELTRIRAEELHGHGDPDDEPSVGCARLGALWQQEVDTVGLEHASLAAVLVRFITWQRLLALGAWTGGYEAVMYLGPPLAMSWVVRYSEWLSTRRLKGELIPEHELVAPTAILILLFSGIPLAIAACSTVSSLMGTRVSVRVCGAVSALAFRKAQRLPLCSSSVAEREAGEDHASAHPASLNLAQVVTSDINGNLANAVMAFCRVVLLIPVCVLLLVMVFVRIRGTVLLTIGTLVVGAVPLAWLCLRQAAHMLGFLVASGRRLQFLESAVVNACAVKAHGWEPFVRRRLEAEREDELAELASLHWKHGHLVNYLMCTPKALIFTSLWGFAWLYPEQAQQTNVFELLPLLYTLQAAVFAVSAVLPQLANARPSLQRVEAFLKQPEAPVDPEKARGARAWLALWPLPGSPDRASAPLRVQGSFSWGPGLPPTLQDVDLVVQPGECVAVIGGAGSGKSALLLAVLGELFPSSGSSVHAPAKIAYSAQTPYICEGTLRENILFGETLDVARYSAVLAAVCLQPDLQVLPGGDAVAVGSRGVSLSAGQRARISAARAAYAQSGLVLLDDPLCALDAPTARHVLNDMVHGTAMAGRTRLVICQPDAEHLAHFDRVIVVSEGHIVAQGSPREVMDTRDFQSLRGCQSSAAVGSEAAVRRASAAGAPGGVVPWISRLPDQLRAAPRMLREDEPQSRVDWRAICCICTSGGWLKLLAFLVLLALSQVASLMQNVVLQRWASAQVRVHAGALRQVDLALASTHMRGYLSWWALGVLGFLACWGVGVLFTVSASRDVHAKVVTRLWQAPLDHFFNRTPVGRIMNRMSSDLQGFDLHSFGRAAECIGSFCQFLVPVVYIHTLLPLYFTVASVPFYYLASSLAQRYWNTMVPMRYLTQVSKSETSMALLDLQLGSASTRAMQKSDDKLHEFQELMSDQLKADFSTVAVVKRWLVNRLLLLGGYFLTCLALLHVWVPGAIGFGAVGLCLILSFQIIQQLESYVDAAASAQFQVISAGRLLEYTALPQERPGELPGDGRYASFAVRLARADLGPLELRGGRGSGEPLVVVRRGAPDRAERVVLEVAPYGQALQAPAGASLALLQPGCEELQGTCDCHRITAVDGERGTAELLASRICDPELGSSLTLEVESGWLAQGARLVVEDLCVGYGDNLQDVLKEVSFEVEPFSKAAIVGSGGCGKSTLLLALLRILEPRSGRVWLGGVDTQALGLRALRSAIGLVPEDPMIMRCSVRENLDPFGHYSDQELWNGLRMVQLEHIIQGLTGGLDSILTGPEARLSFGQRQLLCLARMVLRQPRLLLLDEVTSSLDPRSQELVQRMIRTAFPRSTVVVVAQHLESIVDLDHVVVMNHGRVAEQGPVKELASLRTSALSKMLGARRTLLTPKNA